MLIVRAILSTIALIFVIFSIYHLKTKGVDKSLFYLDPAAQPSFDHTRVTHFEWKTKELDFIFDKTSKDEWFPKDRHKKVSDLLQFLSQIQLNDVEQKGIAAITTSITLNQEVWTGAWDGMSFIWTSGPHKGKGEILKQEKNIAFFKGKFVFEPVNINLCENRINRIQFSTPNGAATLESIGRTWQITSPIKMEVNPIFIEKWLIGLCKVNSKTLIDLNYSPSQKTTGFLKLDFIDKKSLSFQQIEKDFYIFEGNGIIMEGLNDRHEEIKAASKNWGL